MKFNIKIFISFLFILIILFLLNTNVNASYYNGVYIPEPVSIDNNSNYYIYYNPNDSKIHLLTFNGDIEYLGNFIDINYSSGMFYPSIWFKKSDNTDSSKFVFGFMMGNNRLEYELNNSQWVLVKSDYNNHFSSLRYNYDIINNIICSNYNICNGKRVIGNSDIVYSSNSASFFQEPVQEVVVPALGEVKELPKAIVETLKIIIPVGLVILGIGFVIYLIKSVILRVI